MFSSYKYLFIRNFHIGIFTKKSFVRVCLHKLLALYCKIVSTIGFYMAQLYDFSGVWHCAYDYTSSTTAGKFTSEYDAKVHSIGNQVIIQSIPNDFGDYIFIKLVRDNRILTGDWYEQTSPKGRYKGAIYYGALQLIISEDGNKMNGKWVGFDRQMNVRSNNWRLEKK